MLFSGFLRCCAIAAVALFVGAVHAQPPQEIAVTDAIKLSLGETRVLKFDQPVTKLEFASKGVAYATPQSDHTFVVQADGYGQVLATAYGEDGRVFHRMIIVVADHLVKIYGNTHRKDPSTASEYVSYNCTATGCGHADQDVEAAPSKVTISKTRKDENGDSSTVEKEYR
ncbi:MULTISPECIES: pilus assembly protein N-terminal domain-containing protein [unclassified Bradyrhizobium]